MDKVKLAICTPEGRFSVADDYEYWHLKIKQADYYYRDRGEMWAVGIYRDVLNHTVKMGKYLKSIKN